MNSEFFARILFSLIALKDIFATFNLRPGHDLHISVKGRVILPYCEFYFHKTSHMRSYAKIKPSRKFLNLQLWRPAVRQFCTLKFYCRNHNFGQKSSLPFKSTQYNFSALQKRTAQRIDTNSYFVSLRWFF